MSNVRLAFTGRIRNGVMWEAVARHGSNRTVAKKLGVTASTFGRWILLKCAPSPRWIARKEKLIFNVFGVSAEYVWPNVFRNKVFCASKKTFAKTVEVTEDQLLYLSEHPELSSSQVALPSPIDTIDARELTISVKKAIEQLPEKLQNIVFKKFGMCGHHEHTYDEIGKELGVSRERVRQLHARAIRTMRHPKYIRKFIEAANG